MEVWELLGLESLEMVMFSHGQFQWMMVFVKDIKGYKGCVENKKMVGIVDRLSVILGQYWSYEAKGVRRQAVL